MSHVPPLLYLFLLLSICSLFSYELERTLILLKPDALSRSLLGRIVSRFEDKGFKIENMKMIYPSKELISEHYVAHSNKSYFNELIESYKTKIVAIILSGESVIQLSRRMIGSTNPMERLPGTIRGDYSSSKQFNLIHGSDSKEEAEREIKIWFKEEEGKSNSKDL